MPKIGTESQQNSNRLRGGTVFILTGFYITGARPWTQKELSQTCFAVNC